MAAFKFQEMFELGPDTTEYRKLTSDHVSTAKFEGRDVLKVEPEALTLIAAEAMDDISHLHRSGHLAQLRKILDDPEASDNDRFVALELLLNANISAGRVLPTCQDTGTVIVIAHKGQHVFTVVWEVENLEDAKRWVTSQGFEIMYEFDNGTDEVPATIRQLSISPERTHGMVVTLLERARRPEAS